MRESGARRCSATQTRVRLRPTAGLRTAPERRSVTTARDGDGKAIHIAGPAHQFFHRKRAVVKIARRCSPSTASAPSSAPARTSSIAPRLGRLLRVLERSAALRRRSSRGVRTKAARAQASRRARRARRHALRPRYGAIRQIVFLPASAARRYPRETRRWRSGRAFCPRYAQPAPSSSGGRSRPRQTAQKPSRYSVVCVSSNDTSGFVHVPAPCDQIRLNYAYFGVKHRFFSSLFH